MNNFWMIDPTAEEELRLILMERPTPEQLAAPEQVSGPVDIVNGVARIPIQGFLTKTRNRMMDIFGIPQTSFVDIRQQVRDAEADEAVSSIEFQVNSPGGNAGNQLLETAEAIRSVRKPTVAVVQDMGASAAFWLASQADEILLSGSASMVGSIGVAVDMRVDDDVFSIVSSAAPKKRPDPRTTEGQTDIRKTLNDLHALFVDAVASGRGVTAAVVNSDFGQGGLLLAAEAVEVGMADRVIRSGANVARRGTVATMDLDTLKTAHPELYTQCVAIGVTKERGRVSGHLELADASGQMETAVVHIKAGTGVADDTVIASHTAAKLRSVGQVERQNDNIPAVGNAPPPQAGTNEDADIRATFAETDLKATL